MAWKDKHSPFPNQMRVSQLMTKNGAKRLVLADSVVPWHVTILSHGHLTIANRGQGRSSHEHKRMAACLVLERLYATVRHVGTEADERAV